MNRDQIIETLKQNPKISVLIVGAGINGVGTFRDLALNGVDVLLIDRGDFCSGASSASSHMAHGGIRYLENGEFRLVREAVQERNRMILNAPHIVQPLPTVIPIFKFWSGLFNAPFKFIGLLDKPAERGAFVIKVGLIFYDFFTRKQGTVPKHKFFARKKALQAHPAINPDVKYVATYYDGSIQSPERYVVELVADAEAEGSHARALNYVSLVGARDQGIVLRNEVDGSTFEVTPRLVINAAGPWIDESNRALGLGNRYIGGTKGSHLILDNAAMKEAIGRNEFFFENKDGRIVLIFPLADKVMIGTSDLPIENPDEAICTDKEIDYFLEMTARVFPGINIERDEIVFQFSGVRPLEYSHAKSTGQITRDHSIKEDSLGNIPVYSLVGGKWTSYRAFSEQAADKAMTFLGRQRSKDTQVLPVGGGREYPITGYAQLEFYKRVEKETGLGGREPERLFKKYGTRALDFAAYITAGADAPLKTATDWTRREVEYLAQAEKVVHLDDLFLRRSMLAWLGELTLARVDEFADVLGDVLGWTAAQKKAEVERCLSLLKSRHAVELKP